MHINGQQHGRNCIRARLHRTFPFFFFFIRMTSRDERDGYTSDLG